MGMSIDKAIDIMERYEMYGFFSQRDGRNKAIDTMRKYQLMQADYENRLKADMVVMLTDLQLEIEELDVSDVVPEYQDGAEETKEYIANMIEQKISSLKEV